MTAELPPAPSRLAGEFAGRFDGRSDNDWAGTYTLPNSPRSPALARMLVRQALADCPPSVTDAAELLVSELVTNAVRHAETDLILHISTTPGVRVVVEDTSPDPIEARIAAVDTDAGRGLAIVDAVATAWGWESSAFGKRTWFEV
jgi:anti-sigma regulatory factor (Ser/Thr protein kinase)